MTKEMAADDRCWPEMLRVHPRGQLLVLSDPGQVPAAQAPGASHHAKTAEDV